MFVADTPEKVHFFRLVALKGRLKLEIKGMRFGIPTGPAVKKMFGLPKGCRLTTALKALEAEIERLQDEKDKDRKRGLN